jgi:large subunit ribosomal protein L17
MILLNIFESCSGRTPWELLLWLLGAFILGYLLRYFLEKKSGKEISSATVSASEPYKDSTVSPSIIPAPVVPKSEPAKSKKDDLTKIEGIGPKINQLLNNAGIHTFQDLAQSEFETLKSILYDAGERFRIHDPTTWPKQAGLAADGLWEELKKLQDHLKGGREE